jgi:uncharacterized membrane protein YesL
MQIFKQGNPFNDFMSRVGDLAMINIAWLVCCIPLATIGASTAAMYEVVRSLHEEHDSHVIKQFGHAFTRRFGASLALELVAALFIGIGSFDLWYLTKQVTDADFASLAYGITLAIAAVVLAGAGFVFPLTSRSKLGIIAQIKQSFAVAVAHPLASLEILALNVLPFAIAIFAPGGLAFVTFFWGLLLTAASAWLTIHVMLRSGIIAMDSPTSAKGEKA